MSRRRADAAVRRSRRLTFALLAAALVGAGCSESVEWREFRWEGAGFAVLLPARPSKDTRSVKLGAVTLDLTLFRTEPDGSAVAIGYADLPAGLAPAARLQLLEQARDAFLANVGATERTSEAVALAGHPGLAFRGTGAVNAAGKRLVVAGRVYATDRRFYQQLMIAPAGHPIERDATLFFGSLRLIE